MHHSAQTQNLENRNAEGLPPGFSQVPEMHLYSRYEHGNLPVRVYRDDENRTLYDVEYRTDQHSSGKQVLTFTSARQMISHFYGHDVHMPFDRYFRIGRYRQRGRASGHADLLSLLDERQGGSRKTNITVHGKELQTPRKTKISVHTEHEGVSNLPDSMIAEFVSAMEEDLLPLDEFLTPTSEMKDAFEKSFQLELDRVEGLVGIKLDEKSGRRDSNFKADEVRKLLWKGFAGKMLSQGYDPEDVLQEVYRGLLVRNNGKCPWDARKSTFGHYVFLVIGCVLTNYHRKQVRRIDKDAIPLTLSRDGEEMADIGQYGSCHIEYGSELGDMLAIDELASYLESLPDKGPEAVLGREILPLVASGHQRGEIVREIGAKPSLVSRALAWLRVQTALWATECGFGNRVPVRYLVPSS